MCARYPASRPPTCPSPKPAPRPRHASCAEGVAGNVDSRGMAVYAGACAGCHDWTGVSPVIPYATLIGVRSVNDPTGANDVQVILTGAHRRDSDPRAAMPPF